MNKREREELICAAEALDETISFVFETPILIKKENDFLNYLRHFHILDNSSVYVQSGDFILYKIDLTNHPDNQMLWERLVKRQTHFL